MSTHNHTPPKKIVQKIPTSISDRLSRNSSNIEIFDRVKKTYQSALKKSGYKNVNLEFKKTDEKKTNNNKNKNKRQRNILWFTPTFNKQTKTSIGKIFLQLIDKHFPPNNPLHEIFNRNNVKVSYINF